MDGGSIATTLADKDSLIKYDFVGKRQFLIYHSAEYVDDIPALTLFQISELCKSKHFSFKAVLRVSKDAQ